MTDLIVSGIDSLLPFELESVTNLLEQYSLQYEIRQYTCIDVLTNVIYLVFGFSLSQLKEYTRKSNITYARWIFFFEMHRFYPKYTLAEIGAFLDRSRSTVESDIKAFKKQNNPYNPLLYDFANRVEFYLNSFCNKKIK